MAEDYQGLTPPPELVEEWLRERPPGELAHAFLATQAARWGADQELEACVEWLLIANTNPRWALALQEARRPKPPSLAEEALEQLSSIGTAFKIAYGGDLVDTPIRRALERLQELEGAQ